MKGESELFQSPVCVLVVCTGNVCRSPLAQGLLKLYIDREGFGADIALKSAGTNTVFGQSASPESVQIATELGADIRFHRSQPLSSELMDWADIVLVMEYAHLSDLVARYPLHSKKCWMLAGFAESRAAKDIPDPWGQGIDAYRETGRLLGQHLERIVAELVKRVKDKGMI